MWKENQLKFDEVAERCGSTYAAINLVAKSARKKMMEIDTPILDSHAISWELTGRRPETKRAYSSMNYNIDLIDDILASVDDEDICQSVRDSYYASLKAHHLIYFYNPGLDESKRARVRVLTRMVWGNIKY